MEFLNQRQLEEFATEVEDRGIWLREISWVQTVNPRMFLLNLLSEIVPDNQREAKESINRFSYAIASSSFDLRNSSDDSDFYARNSVIQTNNVLAIQDGWKPLVKSIVSYSGIENPILLLPLVDYEINFHDQSAFIDSVGRWLPEQLSIIVVSGVNFSSYWDTRKVRNNVICLTDGQYNALRQGKIRKYESPPLIPVKSKVSQQIKIVYSDPVTGFVGEFFSDKPEKDAINDLNSELGFKVDITEVCEA